MYKYVIPSPKKGQYTLLFGKEAKLLIPINVAKSVSYLKTKINAHRNMIGADDTGIYSIEAPDGTIVFTRVFNNGEQSNTTTSYHKMSQKPKIIYKRVFLYDPAGDLTDIERENENPITYYDAICNSDGTFATDLELLKHLSIFLYSEPVPVFVTKKALVNMATYLPQNKESFINLPGIGEKLYNKCGEIFLSEIHNYLAEKAIKQ